MSTNRRALHITLPKKIVKKNLDSRLTKMFLGGLGYNAKILYDEVGSEVDPFSPKNIIVISPGALNGSEAPTACRTEVSTKSPLTGIFGTGNFGGYWGQAFKNAGYDTMVIREKSPSPVYILVDDDNVEIREATHLWGKDAWDTAEVLKQDLGLDFSVMAIGQAGENLVRNSTVIIDREHAPGRSQVGAVFGDKKLKAIAVRGTGKPSVRSPEKFMKAVNDVTEKIKNFPGWRDSGKNWVMNITMPDYRETVEKFVIDGGYGSFCPCILGSYFMCNMVAEINEGNYKGTRVSMGLSQGAFMARNLGISLPAAFRLRELCHRYGLDYWEEPLLFFLELYQKGIITKSDTDGLEIVKGNEPVMIELLGKIAYRNGFGDIIAEGVERASKIIGRGSENYVISMKGLELVGDPRTFSPDKRLSIQVNPRGGDDLKGTHGAMPFWGEPIWARRLNWNEEEYLDWVLKRHDMFDDVKKIVYGSPPNLHNLDSAMLVKWYNDLSCVFNSLGFCMFSDSFEAMGPTLYAELYSDVTGHLISPVELMVVGERVFNVMRSFNVREGMRREQDDYPQRFYEQSLRRGDETYTLSKEAVDRSLQTYYEYRGWDTKTGVPTQEKLRELQLHDVADDMKKLSY